MEDLKIDILFLETQKFKQWWIWIILISINGVLLYTLYSQVILGMPISNNPMSNLGLVFANIFSLLISVLFVNFSLETRIKKEGLYVRFFPFHLKFRYFAWKEIEKSYVRQYKPIMEYGGWGIRGFGKNKALNMSGNMGLQLEMKDGNKLLIGTNKAEELLKVLNNLNLDKAS